MLALLLVPIAGMIGGAIDMSRAVSAENRAQIALDAALLHVAHDEHTMRNRALRKEITSQFKQRLGDSTMNINRARVWRDGQTLTAEVTGHIDTTFLRIVGVRKLNVMQTSQVIYGDKRTEIALVLDVTGSMQGDKLTQLKAAAHEFVDRVETFDMGDDMYGISVVPFSTFVNVGPSNRNENWLDRVGLAPVSEDNFAARLRRMDLLSHLGESWSGCVLAREHPLDVDDTPPRNSDPETLFTPLVYPDEPDDRTRYANTYLNDDDPALPLMDLIGDLDKYGIAPGDERNRLRWTPVVQQPDYKFYSDVVTPPGPGFNCPSQAILPISDNYSRISAAIDALEAGGTTNMTEGLAWGWRTLSRNKPFRQGRNYNDRFNVKVMILLSDGNNHINLTGDDRGSDYTAYGYLANNRLGLPMTATQSDLIAELDRRTLEVCKNIKDAGITLYTIRLELADTRSETVLKNCATSSEHYLDVPDADKLTEAFSNVARRVTALFLSK